MNTLGKTKDTNTDETYRQFIINCLGTNDRRKYFLVTSFGEDFNVPVDIRGLTSESNNKDDKFVLGFLNKVKINDLNPGDKAIFSTSEDGKTIQSFHKLLNDGTQHFNGDADFLAGFTELKSGFDTAITDLNNAINVLNQIVNAFAAWVPAPNDGGAALKAQVTGITQAQTSSATIDASKKDNLKTE